MIRSIQPAAAFAATEDSENSSPGRCMFASKNAGAAVIDAQSHACLASRMGDPERRAFLAVAKHVVE
jgi:hypothetical protein